MQGRLPFKAKDQSGLFKAIVKGVYDPLPDSCSAPLKHIMKGMLMINPVSAFLTELCLAHVSRMFSVHIPALSRKPPSLPPISIPLLFSPPRPLLILCLRAQLLLPPQGNPFFPTPPKGPFHPPGPSTSFFLTPSLAMSPQFAPSLEPLLSLRRLILRILSRFMPP